MISKFTQWTLVAAVVAGGSVLAFAARPGTVRPGARMGTFDPFNKTSTSSDSSTTVVVTGVSRRLVEPPFRPAVKSTYRRPPMGPPTP